MSYNAFDEKTFSAADAGWVVVDPAGMPYSWHSLSAAPDETAAWSLHEPNTSLLQQLQAVGWRIRPGRGIELVDARPEVRASA